MEIQSIAITLLIIAGVVLGAMFGVAVGAAAGLIQGTLYAVATARSSRVGNSAD